MSLYKRHKLITFLSSYILPRNIADEYRSHSNDAMILMMVNAAKRSRDIGKEGVTLCSQYYDLWSILRGR